MVYRNLKTFKGRPGITQNFVFGTLFGSPNRRASFCRLHVTAFHFAKNEISPRSKGTCCAKGFEVTISNWKPLSSQKILLLTEKSPRGFFIASIFFISIHIHVERLKGHYFDLVFTIQQLVLSYLSVEKLKTQLQPEWNHCKEILYIQNAINILQL